MLQCIKGYAFFTKKIQNPKSRIQNYLGRLSQSTSFCGLGKLVHTL